MLIYSCYSFDSTYAFELMFLNAPPSPPLSCFTELTTQGVGNFMRGFVELFSRVFRGSFAEICGDSNL